MTISNPFTSGKTDNTDTVTATEILAVGASLAKAIDGVGGGTYSPSAKITIDGANGLEIGSTHKLKIASRSITRAQTAVKIDVGNNTSAISTAVVQTGDTWVQELLIPNGVTVTAITAYINPADDALPTTNAQILFRKLNVTDGTLTTISTTTDPNTGASYQAAHGFGPTGLSEVITRSTHNYFVQMNPESGGDVDDYEWYGTTVTYTATTMDDGY